MVRGRQRGGDLRKNPQVHEFTADDKQRDTILEDLGQESESKSLGCPDKMDESGEDELPMEGVPIFRSIAARSNPVRRKGAVRVDVEADPKVVEAAEAVGVLCG